MSAISEIKIDGFKAFPNDFTLEFKGKNLLLYGENGSGKSSIYYALHTLLQSQCKNKNNVYFNIAHPESILNKHTKKTDAKVEIKFEDDDTIYRISQNGYEELPTPGISPLRDLNGQCVFINHKFLFNIFSFRNSQYIDLFPVFIKDILPFVLTQDGSEYISMIYDEVMKGIKRRGRSNKIEESYQTRINKFNLETKYLIDLINSNATETATSIFNKHFRNVEDRQLKITLEYDNNRDNVPQPDKSYWLRCGHRYIYIEKAGIREEKSVSTNMEILQPSITLKVEELQDDGISYFPIEKPHTYFNEAKLTAIALSIRFALLDTISDINGRFIALDDMLISLDMSNRAKVVDFLLDISDRYKIYLFTHDRLFFEYFKERILYFNKAKNISHYTDWLIKELYKDETSPKNPILRDSETDITKAIKYYKEFDYPAAANYLRKAVENLISNILPDKLSRQKNGERHEKLRNTLDTAFAFFQNIPEFDLTDLSRLIGNLNLLLNPLSHKSTETNVYKTELKEIFDIIDRLKLQIVNLRLREIIPRNQKIYMHFIEDEHITQKYEIELLYELYTYEIDGIKHIYPPEAKSTRSCTITDGLEGVYNPNSYYKGNLEKICQDVHTYKKHNYENNYIIFYKDKDGTPLTELIKKHYDD